MITVTDQARDYLTSFDKDIRIEVKGGGCAGFSYDYNFNSDEPDPLDFIVDLGSDRRLIVDKTSLLFVIGTQLDYEKKLGSSQLVFKNPNEKTSCGCGKSFSV